MMIKFMALRYYNRVLLTIFSTLALQFAPAPLAMAGDRPESTKGGWGSSGGGSGVACFDSEETAQVADGYISANKPLPAKLKRRIKSLKTLDFWEWEKRPNSNLPVLVLVSDKHVEILKAVYERMTFIAPIFVRRLQQGADIIKVTDWNQKKSVPRINDAKPRFKIPLACRQVQLAARYSEEPLRKEGPARYVPVVRVDIDQELFAMLNPLNKAILVLHEQMYMLAQTMGYKDSLNVRLLAMRIFEIYLVSTPKTMSSLSADARETRWLLVKVLGDYIAYFGEDLKEVGVPFSQESRFQSFYQMNQQYRARIGRCLQAVSPEGLKTSSEAEEQACKDQVMQDMTNFEWMTDEMAFLFVSHYFLDISSKFINAEMLMAPFHSVAFTIESNRQLQFACDWIKVEGRTTEQVKVLMAKARQYCRDLPQ